MLVDTLVYYGYCSTSFERVKDTHQLVGEDITMLSQLSESKNSVIKVMKESLGGMLKKQATSKKNCRRRKKRKDGRNGQRIPGCR